MKTVKIVAGVYYNQLEDAINKEIKKNPDKDVLVINAYCDNKGMHYAILEINDK